MVSLPPASQALPVEVETSEFQSNPRLVDPVCFELTINLCSRMSQWSHAVSLLRDMRSLSLKTDIMCATNVVESMVSDGQLPGAIALFRYLETSRDPCASDATDAVPLLQRKRGAWDLHGLPVEMARLAVRVILLDVASRLTTESWRNPEEHGLQANGNLDFIVGLGQHSKSGESLLGPSVLEMLDEEFGLKAHFLKNEGQLRLPKHQVITFAQGPAGIEKRDERSGWRRAEKDQPGFVHRKVETNYVCILDLF